MKLEPAFKAAWIARLRSPEAKQAHGCLGKGEGRCCLGHAAEVMEEQFQLPEGWWLKHYNSGALELHGPDLACSAGSIPPAVFGAFFLDKKPLDLGKDYISDFLILSDFLIHKNDSMGWTLPKIADWIEANL